MEIVYLLFSLVTGYIGYMFGKKETPIKLDPITEEQKHRKEKLQRDFSTLMEYNENIAIGGKTNE